MPNGTSRPSKNSERKYAGDPWAGMVTRWLNCEDDPEGRDLGKNTKFSRNRVHDLIDNIREVFDAIKSAPHRDLLAFPPRRLSALMNELNARIHEYPTACIFMLECSRTGFFGKGYVAGERPGGESLAAQSVVELTNKGLLDRLKECDCGRWFFSRFSHQNFCSDRCRKKRHETSEQFRASRREYMRRYYRLKASGKVK
jgi:hypothetical protein